MKVLGAIVFVVSVGALVVELTDITPDRLFIILMSVAASMSLVGLIFNSKQ